MKKTLESIYKALKQEDIRGIEINGTANKIGLKTADKQQVIFLSVSGNRSQAFVINGKGKNIKKAVESAAMTYINEKPADFDLSGVKLDIVIDLQSVVEAKEKFNISDDDFSYDRGNDGISFDKKLDTAFLPEEIIAYQLIKKDKIAPKNFPNALDNRLPGKTIKNINYLDETDLYRIKTQAYYINENNFHELYRGHQIFSELTKEDLWSAIKLTKDNYFKNVLNNKGKFIYSFLPHRNKKNKEYNILRHAGTTYSMIETYELMPDKDLLEEIKKAITFLLGKLKRTKINGYDTKVVVEDDIIKVGGNALAIVALAKYTKVTGDKQYVPIMQSMALWIKEVLDANGQFKFFKQRYSNGEISDFLSHYYPGESILAFVRLFQIDQNEEWLDAAEKASKHLINVRDKDDTIDTIAHDHWLLYGLNDLYRERKDNQYVKHSFFISDAIMKTQIEPGQARAELVGGYVPKSGNEPKSTPVACRSEGLSASYKLAKDLGYKDKAKKIRKAIQQGIKFQLQMQLRPESIMYFKNKNLCLGAVHGGLKTYELRNDYTQHNISSFIAFYNILNIDK